MLWIVKLTVTPLLVGLMSWVARVWGPTVGGLIMGLPWMTGPILFFFALEHGPDYTVKVASGVQLGAVAIVAWAFTFAALARRFPWPICVASAAGAYALAGYALSGLELPLVQASMLGYAALLTGFTLLPRPRTAVATAHLPWWDIPARMLATAGLVAIIIVASERIGPALSGIVATYPVIMTVISSFMHHRWGADAVLRLLRAVMLSLNGFVTFFLVLGLLDTPIGTVPVFALATLAGVAFSGALIVLARYRLLPP